MAGGTGSSSRRWDIEDRNGIRIVYGSCSLPIEIRSFKSNAKIGDPVDSILLFYDSNGNMISMLENTSKQFVNNIDIRVPEMPEILSVTPPSPNISVSPVIDGQVVSGLIPIVKDGDIVEIIEVNTNIVLGTGIISSNLFSITIDLSSFDSGSIIVFKAQAFNEKRKFHGGSKASISRSYQLL